MRIIELHQGYYSDLSGVPHATALLMFTAGDADFLARNPKCALYHRPSWREFEARETETAPWGHEWWVVDTDGLLRLHSAYYDSSG